MVVGDRLRRSLAGTVWRVRTALADVLASDRARAALGGTGVYDALRTLDGLAVDRTPVGKPPNAEVSAGGVTCTFHVGSIRESELFWTRDGPRRYPESEDDMPVLVDLLERIESDDAFWDVGANVGIYGAFAGQVVESGSVVAVEPRPENVARIERNMALNGVSARVAQCALSNRTGAMAFRTTGSDGVGGSGVVVDDEMKPQTDHGASETTVGVVRGDELAESESIPSPSVLKIDVEGAEYDALRGLDGVLADEDCRLVYCDVCSEMTDVPDEAVHGLLRDHGFEVERIWDWPYGDGHYVRAEKRRQGDGWPGQSSGGQDSSDRGPVTNETGGATGRGQS
ncbi:FkbM family methyltransferase [Halorussus litoreus]|uniref:FkbM family methyltransferase n=1 Tax=Halorussus litoreus TaxID=1710536 RepID=UPI000E284DFF|nr:FkbM family methyltransferase [Halorussus litoreus]